MRCEISQPSLKCMVLCCYGKMEIAVWFLRGRMEKKDAVIHILFEDFSNITLL